MAYTEPDLNEASPPETQKIKLGAARIRGLTKAIEERLASFFVDPNADPLVPKDNKIELAKLTAAARLGLYKGEIITWAPAALIVPISSGGGAIIPAGHSVDQLAMFISIKTTDQLTAALANLLLSVYGSGANINLTYHNFDTVFPLDLRNTVFNIMVLTPVP